ncbi:MAG: sugar ABC transporter ATP-binding protein [Verrucomicrobia bacterium]|nr:sugar ABC transporter ATP-binding protein [Verrucomicrobiota bacterium]
MAEPLLRLESIAKSFGEVSALKPIRLDLYEGEVLGLVGENGAGKSTLIKILSGVHQPDSGTLLWNGIGIRIGSPLQAIQTGIATIHQELAYFGRLTVAENLMMGDRWPRFPWGGVRWSLLHRQARERLDRCGLEIPTDRLVDDLSPAQKQEIAIARALSRNARVLVLDEPTASLTEPEVLRLFEQLNALRRQGVAILYVSHRLDEIMQLTDRVAVLRDGELVATYPTPGLDLNQVVRDMVGRPLDQVFPRTRSRAVGVPLLELEQVSHSTFFKDVSFSVRAGEVVGLAGLVGAGRSELARAVYGLYPVESGRMRLMNREWRPRTPHQSVRSGLVYLPEERKRQSLVLEHSVSDSISIGFSDLICRWGLVDRAEEHSRVAAAHRRYSIRSASPRQPIGTLSGGNQQKCILARWLDRDPAVIVLDEPTRGVDVGAKAEIHALIDRLAGDGKAVLLISSDLPEILGMSDRILVMHQGRIAAEMSDKQMTQENVIRAASGLPVSGASSEPESGDKSRAS